MDDHDSLTGGRVSGRPGRSLTQGMMRLIRRRSGCAIGSYAAAGRASGATPIDAGATTHDRLVQATSKLDTSQIATMSVHGVVVTWRQ